MKWIKTADRMPEPNVDVLFFPSLWNIKGDVQDRVEAGYYSRSGMFWMAHGEWVAEELVTHWIPFPDAPEEE